MLIRELPNEAKPRERLVAYGPRALSDYELLAVLIGTGCGEDSALDLAQKLISRDPEGLVHLASSVPEELAKVKGIGTAKAAVIVAACELGRRIASRPRDRAGTVTESAAVASLLMEELRYLKQEVLCVILLNTKGRVLGTERISMGDLSTTIMHPREIFLPAVKKSAACIILAHNHPSGDPTPSAEDVAGTKRLIEAGEIMGISVLDHLVIGDGIYTSMRDKNLI